MKVRNGFVSNSSSSSFCLYGIYTDKIKDYDEIERICKQYDLEYASSDGEFWIGLGPDRIQDDETSKEFKARVVERLVQIFKDDPLNPGWICETTY